MEKKKILYFTDCYIFGGCENILVNLMNDSEFEQKYKIIFSYRHSREYKQGMEGKFPFSIKKYPLFLFTNDSIIYRLNASGVNKMLVKLIRYILYIVKMTGIYSALNFIVLYGLFRLIRPHMLHINNGGYPGASTCRVAVFSAKAAGVKHILFNVNNLAQEQKGQFDKYVDRFLMNNTDYFITASSEAMQRMIQKRKIAGEKVIQIYNSVKAGKVIKNRNELMAQYKLDKNKFIITEVALLTERKGQMQLLSAMSRIKHSEPHIYKNIMLFLVGDGEDSARIKAYIHGNSMQEHVVLTGSRNDFMDYINMADLIVLPSLKDEDMPLVILHAMELKKPIISTKLAGIIEEINNGIEGILLDTGDVDGLAGAIVELYTNPQKRERIGVNARKRYDEQFNMKKNIGEYAKLYKQLLLESVL